MGPQDRYGRRATAGGPSRRRSHACACHPASPLVPVLATVLAALASLLVVTAPAAHADGPGSGTPWVVTVGDSYISGEAGRWAGSSNTSSSYADALGATAYYDNAGSTRADQPLPPQQGRRGLHRRRRQRPEPRLLAARGPRRTPTPTATSSPASTSTDDGAGQLGQAKMLQQFAATHNVKMVVVSIGGNDFNFGVDRAAAASTDFLGSPSWFKDYCNDDSSVTANFTAANVAPPSARGSPRPTPTSGRPCATPGTPTRAWTLLVQNYPSPLPDRERVPLLRRAATRGRAPAAAASGTPTPTGPTPPRCRRSTAPSPGAATARRHHQRQDPRPGLGLQRPPAVREHGRALRGEGPDRPGPRPARSTRPSGSTRSAPCRPPVGSPYYVQESLHPNYWAQLATRSCVRQAWNGGTPRGGACTIGGTGPRQRRAADDLAVTPSPSCQDGG